MIRSISDKQEGYIALISAIVITAVLIGLTFTLSFSNFFTRFNVLDTEYKKVSYALAEGCVNVARLKLANNQDYSPTADEEIDIDANKSCWIRPVAGSGGFGSTRTIQVYSDYQNAFSNLEVDVTLLSDDVRIDTWKECPNLADPPPSC